MVTLNEAARVSGMSELTVCRLVEFRAVHSVESTEGLLFICLESLLTQRRLPGKALSGSSPTVREGSDL